MQPIFCERKVNESPRFFARSCFLHGSYRINNAECRNSAFPRRTGRAHDLRNERDFAERRPSYVE